MQNFLFFPPAVNIRQYSAKILVMYDLYVQSLTLSLIVMSVSFSLQVAVRMSQTEAGMYLFNAVVVF